MEDEGAVRAWDAEKMIELLCYTQTMSIISTVQPPPGHGSDQLVFQLTTNGGFKVGKAYDALRKEAQPPNEVHSPL